MDELERRLRRLLHDANWTLEPPPDALDRVHRGAARRQRRRRTAAGGLSCLAVVAVVTAALTVQPVRDQLTAGPAGHETSATPTPEPSSSASVKAQPSHSQPSERTHPPARASTPTRTRPGGPVPQGFEAASVTAVSTSTFWVLGTAPCDNPVCTSIVRTRDGGGSFRGMPAPKAPLAEGEATARTVRDLRFASMTDGYAFGGALWSTHDGGATWDRQSLPGSVVHLTAAAGTAWALVDTGGSFHLYRSPTTQDAWRQVSLPESLDGPEPDIAVQGRSITITGSSDGRAVTLTSTGSGFTAEDMPCDPGLTATLSAMSEAVWMFCATGTQGEPYVSTNHGSTWTPVAAAPAGGWPNAAVVGARTEDAAVVAAGGRVYGVSTGGSVTTSDTPAVGDGESFEFVGFTTPRIGYAVLSRPTTDSLWRTTDGGRSWSVVSYPSS